MDHLKRRQHYVWSHYLRPWAAQDQIWCRRGKSVYRTNIRNVAVERDFYRSREFTNEEIQVLRSMWTDEKKNIAANYSSVWIDSFDVASEASKHLNFSDGSTAELDGLNRLVQNQEENLHNSIENGAVGFLSLLQQGESSFLSNPGQRNDFLYFLCVQFFRTKRMRHQMVSIRSNMQNVEMANIWQVSSHILSMNFAIMLAQKFTELNYYILRTSLQSPFLTGDQPVINTYANPKDYRGHVDELELYYPLTPHLALIVSERQTKKRAQVIDITEAQAIRLNRLIQENSHEQVFSYSREALQNDAEQY